MNQEAKQQEQNIDLSKMKEQVVEGVKDAVVKGAEAISGKKVDDKNK